jgi:hypothetical protein
MGKNILIRAMVLLILISCGKKNSPPISAPDAHQSPLEQLPPMAKEEVLEIKTEPEGLFLAVFNTLNPGLTSKITGAFTFSYIQADDELVIDVHLNNSSPETIHRQSVRVGKRCPQPEDDRNQDGIIDATEGEEVYGKTLIPLDSDLSSARSHDSIFPFSTKFGHYIYSKQTLFSHFIKDLHDHTINDGHAKIPPGGSLLIEERVVVIQGVSPLLDMPSSVRSLGNLTLHQSLPIACGIIKRVLSSPGVFDNGLYQVNEDEDR